VTVGCYLCGEEKPLTNEHIIPQFLGGFLGAPIYCSDCNNSTGLGVDSALAGSFARYATLLDVKRERGTNQPFTLKDDISGIELEFCDGQFRRKVTEVTGLEAGADGDSSGIRVSAKSMRELESITSGISKKHGLGDDSFELEVVQLDAPIGEGDLLLSSEEIYRAVAKIAYGFACLKLPSSTVFSSPFDAIRGYIRGEDRPKCVSLNYESTDFMTDNHRPLNKVHLAFNRIEGIVIGYVAIFGAFRYTVLVAEHLISNLEWPAVDHTSDPIRKVEVPCPSCFVAPRITREKVVNPRYTEESLIGALNLGLNVVGEHSKVLVSGSVRID